MELKNDRLVVAFYLHCLGQPLPVKMIDYSFAGDEPLRAATVGIAAIDLPCQGAEDLHFFGSVGLRTLEGSRKPHALFVGIYDSPDPSLSELIASTTHYDTMVASLSYGHTYPIAPRSPLKSYGYEAALVLDGALYSFFEGVQPATLGVACDVFAVVPLTARDAELKRQHGVEALLESWDELGYDVLQVASSAPA